MKETNYLCKQCTKKQNKNSQLCDVYFHLDYITTGKHWTYYHKFEPILYKNIMLYTENCNAHTFEQRVNILTKDYEKLYAQNTAMRPITQRGPIDGYITSKKRHPAIKGIGNLDYYIEKFGELGEKMYYERYKKSLNSRSYAKYSKISQELFNKIHKNINLNMARKNKLMYAENYGEHRINFNNEDREILPGRITMFVDFKYGNKIIEFDGDYWHQNNDDELRDEILKNKGYEVLRIKESDYKNNSITEITKCLKFLKLL